MEVVGTILGGIFIALLITAALTFGFTMVLIIIIASGILAFMAIAREGFRRWLFVRTSNKDVQEKPKTVIDAEYEDITK
ncbi:MAG: hypothetical protein SFT92_09345 [Rickettsiales bacterium]|nr:hypothetical protein [Rickettsiales bacterium]